MTKAQLLFAIALMLAIVLIFPVDAEAGKGWARHCILCP